MATSVFDYIGLHHVGYLVADIEAAAAHYSGALGYHVESSVIEDPLQTAHVQFLRLAGGTSWLELISPTGQGSKLSSALAKGAGLHHLCYEVSHIEEACQHFKEARCVMLSPPVPAQAFPGRRIAWFMDSQRLLFELVETGAGPLSLKTLISPHR